MSPKLSPWLAKKAGISTALCDKLWQRAVSESQQRFKGEADSLFYREAVERWMKLIEHEGHSVSTEDASRWHWVVRHQQRVAFLWLIASSQLAKQWSCRLNTLNRPTTHCS